MHDSNGPCSILQGRRVVSMLDGIGSKSALRVRPYRPFCCQLPGNASIERAQFKVYTVASFLSSDFICPIDVRRSCACLDSRATGSAQDECAGEVPVEGRSVMLTHDRIDEWISSTPVYFIISCNFGAAGSEA